MPFVCCVHSWTVLRSQCVVEESAGRHVDTRMSRSAGNSRTSGTNEWCFDADEWDEDVDDSSTCCIDEMPTSEGQVLLDNLPSSNMTVRPAANVEIIDVSSKVQDRKSVDVVMSGSISVDEPELLLKHLSVEDQVPKSDVTCSRASTEACSLSDANEQLSNISFESNAGTELEPYYVYVIEEPAITDHLDHVEDLLARYRLQEGSSSTTELESGSCKYVSSGQSLCLYELLCKVA